MQSVFEVLYALHPAAPAIFLAILANGLLAPVIMTAVAKLPFDITKVRALARSGSLPAKYSYYSWLLLAACSALLLVAMVVRLA